jgi:hypothetical protein
VKLLTFGAGLVLVEEKRVTFNFWGGGTRLQLQAYENVIPRSAASARVAPR